MADFELLNGLYTLVPLDAATGGAAIPISYNFYTLANMMPDLFFNTGGYIYGNVTFNDNSLLLDMNGGDIYTGGGNIDFGGGTLQNVQYINGYNDGTLEIGNLTLLVVDGPISLGGWGIYNIGSLDPDGSDPISVGGSMSMSGTLSMNGNTIDMGSSYEGVIENVYALSFLNNVTGISMNGSTLDMYGGYILDGSGAGLQLFEPGGAVDSSYANVNGWLTVWGTLNVNEALSCQSINGTSYAQNYGSNYGQNFGDGSNLTFSGQSGVSGTFNDQFGNTITVTNGVITALS